MKTREHDRVSVAFRAQELYLDPNAILVTAAIVRAF